MGKDLGYVLHCLKMQSQVLSGFWGRDEGKVKKTLSPGQQSRNEICYFHLFLFGFVALSWDLLTLCAYIESQSVCNITLDHSGGAGVGSKAACRYAADVGADNTFN